MKTKEELNALKKDVESLNEKLAELSEEELAEVTGGISKFGPDGKYVYQTILTQQKPTGSVE